MTKSFVLKTAATLAAVSLLNVVACKSRSNNDSKSAVKSKEQINADHALLNSVIKTKFASYEAADLTVADSIVALDLRRTRMDVAVTGHDAVGTTKDGKSLSGGVIKGGSGQQFNVLNADLIFANGQPLFFKKSARLNEIVPNDPVQTLASTALEASDLAGGVTLAPIKTVPMLAGGYVQGSAWCLQSDCARVALVISVGQMEGDKNAKLAGYILTKADNSKAFVIETEASPRRTLTIEGYKASLGDSPREKGLSKNLERDAQDAADKARFKEIEDNRQMVIDEEKAQEKRDKVNEAISQGKDKETSL